MSDVTSPGFGRFRSLVWPIHRTELRKFIPMLLMYALIVFNYSLLKAAKDALVVTAPSSGAEAIPFIKFWAILPMAVFFTFIFTRLSNHFNREKVFYMMMAIFLGFFFLFVTVLYPFKEYLHPNGAADWLQQYLPTGFKGLISVFRNWTFTLFYVMSELWGTTIMTVLFWGFANEVSSINDAKRFYAILGIGANLATILAGKVSVMLSGESLYKMGGQDRWGHCLVMLTLLVIVAGITSTLIYYWMNRRVFKNCPPGFNESKKSKIKMGIRENFAYLAQSKYLMRIAFIVLAFNIALNMIEIVWKDQVRMLYPDPVLFNAYMGKVMMVIGVASTLVGLFVCGAVIRRKGWTLGAIITPLILFITGILFFSYIMLRDTQLSFLATAVGISPLALGALLGSTQNICSRACKFTFFDATKEMAFIPLSEECKLKGKAAIDGVGSRLGKSGGSVIHQGLLLIFGSVSMSTPYVGVFLFIVFVGWMFSVKSLGRKFEAASERGEAIEEEEALPLQEATVTP
ncbi:MAG: NTP/NDP exchange transporter [Simkaniaceae bacterium]|nr:NTP/NDP exchange transporter [Simkaniaceae bacterium]